MKPYTTTLKEFQTQFITNTDGTIGGNFDEIYTTEVITRRDYDDEYHVSVMISGHMTLLAIYNFLDAERTTIEVTYMDSYAEY
jgi:hypothetical protein